MHRLVDLIETLNREEDLLHFVHFDRGIDDLVERKVVHRASALDDVLALAVRANHAAAVNLDLASLANQAELNRIPEEPAQLLKNVGIGGSGADAAVALQE